MAMAGLAITTRINSFICFQYATCRLVVLASVTSSMIQVLRYLSLGLEYANVHKTEDRVGLKICILQCSLKQGGKCANCAYRDALQR